MRQRLLELLQRLLKFLRRLLRIILFLLPRLLLLLPSRLVEGVREFFLHALLALLRGHILRRDRLRLLEIVERLLKFLLRILPIPLAVLIPLIRRLLVRLRLPIQRLGEQFLDLLFLRLALGAFRIQCLRLLRIRKRRLQEIGRAHV